MAEAWPLVRVTFHAIPGRHVLYAAECECGWRSREYRDVARVWDKADEHAAKHEAASTGEQE